LEADLSRKTGPQLLACHLHLESGETWTYQLKTSIYQRLAFAPLEIHFGAIDPGAKITGTVELVSHSLAGENSVQCLPCLPLTSSSEQLKVHIQQPPVEAYRDSVRKQVSKALLTLDAENEAGNRSACVSARYLWQGVERKADLWVTWQVRSYYEVKPSRVFLRKQPSQVEPLRRTIHLQRIDQKPFSIRRIVSSDRSIASVATTGVDAPEHELIVLVDTSENRLTGEIVISTDDPKQPELRVPVTVFGG
jgi:hypothetical protein